MCLFGLGVVVIRTIALKLYAWHRSGEQPHHVRACLPADHPNAYAIVGLEYFLMDQNLSMMGAPHRSLHEGAPHS